MNAIHPLVAGGSLANRHAGDMIRLGPEGRTSAKGSVGDVHEHDNSTGGLHVHWRCVLGLLVTAHAIAV